MSRIIANEIQHTQTGAQVFTLPTSDGSANQLMKTDGSGNLAFATVATTVGSADPLVTGTTTHINQTIGSGFTFNNVTGTQLLGSVSNATDSSIYALIIRQAITFQATGANHNYVQGWLYQTDKTYNQQGTYITHSVYNQYMQNYSFNHIVQWDPTGTQSLSLYVTYALLNGNGNSHSYYVGGKLSNE